MPTEPSITSHEDPTIDNCGKLRFLGGRRAGEEIPITREVFFIGRSQNNNLVLDDRSVSRKHAVLNFLGGQYTISDLNSFKGTKINGKKIKEAQLHHRDRINIGGIPLEFISPEGVPVVPRGKRRWMAVLLLLLAGIAAWAIFALSRPKVTELPLDLLREIEYNYSQGIKAYNVDKDMDSAQAYWQRVLELDPKGWSEQAKKTKKLIRSIPSNNGGAGSR